jgi:hypothetical protein
VSERSNFDPSTGTKIVKVNLPIQMKRKPLIVKYHNENEEDVEKKINETPDPYLALAAFSFDKRYDETDPNRIVGMSSNQKKFSDKFSQSLRLENSGPSASTHFQRFKKLDLNKSKILSDNFGVNSELIEAKPIQRRGSNFLQQSPINQIWPLRKGEPLTTFKHRKSVGDTNINEESHKKFTPFLIGDELLNKSAF